VEKCGLGDRIVKILKERKTAILGGLLLGGSIAVIVLERFGEVALTLAATRWVGLAMIAGLVLLTIGVMIGSGYTESDQ
jgi:CBS domain containing-hemolysin-like protein